MSKDDCLVPLDNKNIEALNTIACVQIIEVATLQQLFDISIAIDKRREEITGLDGFSDYDEASWNSMIYDWKVLKAGGSAAIESKAKLKRSERAEGMIED